MGFSACSMRGRLRLTRRAAPSFRFNALCSLQPWHTCWDMMFHRRFVYTQSTRSPKVACTNATLPSFCRGTHIALWVTNSLKSCRTLDAWAWSSRQSATALHFLCLRFRAKLSRGNRVGSPEAPLTTTFSADRQGWTVLVGRPRQLLAV